MFAGMHTLNFISFHCQKQFSLLLTLLDGDNLMLTDSDPPVVIVGVVSVAIHGVGVGVGRLGEALLILA